MCTAARTHIETVELPAAPFVSRFEKVPYHVKFHKVGGTELRACLSKAMRYIDAKERAKADQLRRLGCDVRDVHSCGMPKAVPNMQALGHGLEFALGWVQFWHCSSAK